MIRPMGEEFAGLGNNIFFAALGSNVSFAFHDGEQIPFACKTLDIGRVALAEPYKPRVVTTDMPEKGFSFFGTCELPDGAEVLFDKADGESETLFNIYLLPSLYKKCYGRSPRKTKKAMNHGGYYKRNTKWKRKAIALYNRYPEQSPFTIGRARVETDDQGCRLILSRKISKTQILKTK